MNIGRQIFIPRVEGLVARPMFETVEDVVVRLADEHIIADTGLMARLLEMAAARGAREKLAEDIVDDFNI